MRSRQLFAGIPPAGVPRWPKRALVAAKSSLISGGVDATDAVLPVAATALVATAPSALPRPSSGAARQRVPRKRWSLDESEGEVAEEGDAGANGGAPSSSGANDALHVRAAQLDEQPKLLQEEEQQQQALKRQRSVDAPAAAPVAAPADAEKLDVRCEESAEPESEFPAPHAALACASACGMNDIFASPLEVIAAAPAPASEVIAAAPAPSEKCPGATPNDAEADHGQAVRTPDAKPAAELQSRCLFGAAAVAAAAAVLAASSCRVVAGGQLAAVGEHAAAAKAPAVEVERVGGGRARWTSDELAQLPAPKRPNLGKELKAGTAKA